MNLDLPAIKKQCEAASEAPWKVGHEPQLNMVAECGDANTGQSVFVYGYHLASAEADAEFIAAARTVVPQLVEDLEEAQKRLKWIGPYTRHEVGCLRRLARPTLNADGCTCGLDAILGENQ